MERTAHLSVRGAASELGVSPALIHKLRSQNLASFRPPDGPKIGPAAMVAASVHETFDL
jgi:hypothetical protein